MWFETDYRRIFMDMHLNDTNSEYLSKLDTKSFVETLVGANVSSVVVKAKSHVGLHYWPSKQGKMHATLKARNLDYVGEMIEKCHKNNINVILYFSQIYDNYAYKNHRSWRMKYASGIGSMFNVSKVKQRYGLVCPNNPGYRKYCKDILTELATTYSFEGIFMDMPFWPMICRCSHCKRRFLKETGRLMPMFVNAGSKTGAAFIEARQRWMEEFMSANTSVLKNINSNIAIEHNMAAVGLSWKEGNTESQYASSDYASGDYYGGYLQQTFMCKYFNNVTIHKPFSYITSKCDRNLYAHTVSRTYDDLAIHCLNALVHNGAFSICDAMNPDGTITEKVYQNEIKKLYTMTKELEQYVSGDLSADVAIWYNTSFKVNKNFIQSNFNLTQIMLENNIAFDVIGAKNISETNAQVICIADAQKISDEEVSVLESYVKKGGNLFVTGSLGNNKRMEKLVGVDIKKTSDYTFTYITPTSCNDVFEDFSKSSPYPVDHTILESEIVANDVDVLATISYPYTLRTKKDFSAIHSDPPGIHTDLPSVVSRNFGDGRILWCATPLEISVAHNCRKTICRLICSMLKSRHFESNAPAFVEVLKWKKDDKTYLSLVNQQTVSPIFPVNGIVVTLDKVYNEIRLVSGNSSDIVICEKNGKSEITIANLDLFQIIECK